MSDTAYPAFGHLLRFWRKVRGMSQEALALNLQSSTRHISFLENGKARPSEALVEAIAQSLQLGERDSSYLRLAAGYLARSQAVDFEAPEFNWLRKATLFSLKAMDPYPAVLMDRYGRLLMVNRSWVAFYKEVVSAEELVEVKNHFEFLFRRPSEGAAQESWRHKLAMILMYAQQEALLTDDPIYHGMVRELAAHPGVPDDWAQIASQLKPMASYRVQQRYKGKLLSLFNVSLNVGAVGPASYVSEPRLAINTLYPEDEALDLGDALDSDLSHPLLFY
ncbi:helix-turn-helix transcriptional regulator [Microbulbifer agarilyticus]|uniref:helix-turn-helix domain-containing protein n=1 Tax=Microbulbifer agarilyticus TaxID=260552 RepID=UPI001C95B6C1|nr:helix-turn-helix domain-containing protein [Microbulbifer agarilyticus]MBY6190928.1 helix-turn-helix transcriptional regulator [Microbulbifer agarilyticus]